MNVQLKVRYSKQQKATEKGWTMHCLNVTVVIDQKNETLFMPSPAFRMPSLY